METWLLVGIVVGLTLQGFLLWALNAVAARLARLDHQQDRTERCVNRLEAGTAVVQAQLTAIAQEVRWRGRISDVKVLEALQPQLQAAAEAPAGEPAASPAPSAGVVVDPLPAPNRAVRVVLMDEHESHVVKDLQVDRFRRGRIMIDGTTRYACCRHEGDTYYYRREMR